MNKDILLTTRELFSTVPETETVDREISNVNGKTKAIYYKGLSYRGKTTHNFAYIGFPNTEMPEGGYPAVIVIHGGGGCAFYEWAEYWNGKGYVCVAPDISGHCDGSTVFDGKQAPENPNGGPCGYKPFVTDLENYKESWLYHCVCDVILLNNLLRADVKVNKDKIALTGISWGSVITAIVCGIDDRFAAFAPVYGGGYIHTTPLFIKEDDAPEDEKLWLENFDPSAYMPKVKKPIMFTCGADEACFSVTNNKKSWDLCGKYATFSWRKELTHYHRWKDEEGMVNVFRFIDNVLKGNAMPFAIKRETLSGKTFSVVTSVKTELMATLCYSFGDHDEKDNSALQWQSKSVCGEDGEYKTEIPNGATMFFMELSDGNEEEFVLSSKMYFIQK